MTGVEKVKVVKLLFENELLKLWMLVSRCIFMDETLVCLLLASCVPGAMLEYPQLCDRTQCTSLKNITGI